MASETTDPRDAFRETFVRIARTRYARVRSLLDAPDRTGWQEVAFELHVLSGEAAMLSFDEIEALAERGRFAAKERDDAALSRILARLESLIEVEAR